MSCAERLLCSIALAALLGVAPAVIAAPAEPQPVDIQADFGELDRSAGRGTYRGNVVIKQGGMRITADEIRIFLVADELSRVEVDGKPAAFEHQAEGASQPTRGMAQSMVYLVKESTLDLKGDARVEQRGDEVAGESIRYDLKSDRVLAASGQGRSDRVQMTITPRRVAPPPDAKPPQH